MKALIYDLEIINAIQGKKDSPREPGINYCHGWGDHAGMGISVLCAYDMEEGRYRVFDAENSGEFLRLANDRVLVSFNGLNFDNKVIAACWNNPTEEGSYDTILEFLLQNAYDILPLMRSAAGATPFARGYKLDDCALQNFGETKAGSGADAPIWWQQGRIAEVVDYCLQDVRLTANLFIKIANEGGLSSPANPGQWISMPPIPPPFSKGDTDIPYL